LGNLSPTKIELIDGLDHEHHKKVRSEILGSTKRSLELPKSPRNISSLFLSSRMLLPSENFPLPLINIINKEEEKIKAEEGKTEFMDFRVKFIARQMTLMEKSMLNSIGTHEIILLRWTKKNKKILAPNVLKMIDRFNNVVSWVSTTIVTQPNGKHRVAVFSKFIQIAEDCIQIHNYNTAMAIYYSLLQNQIRRLEKMWRQLSKKELKIWDQIKLLFEQKGNYFNYRTQLKMAIENRQPVVPYLGLVFQDLTTLNELPTSTECVPSTTSNSGELLEFSTNSRKFST